jgi:hypothetical protein
MMPFVVPGLRDELADAGLVGEGDALLRVVLRAVWNAPCRPSASPGSEPLEQHRHIAEGMKPRLLD